MCLERSMLHGEFNTVFRPLILQCIPHEDRSPAVYLRPARLQYKVSYPGVPVLSPKPGMMDAQ